MCVSRNAFRTYTIPRQVAIGVASFISGAINTALGMPGSAMFAYCVLALGIRPHVAAASSRFVLTAFTFGMFVAYTIAGNLRISYALAYGVVNLLCAPLGVLLFQKAHIRGLHVMLISLYLGLLGMCVLTAAQLAPSLRRLIKERSGAVPWDEQDRFDLARYCSSHHHHV